MSAESKLRQYYRKRDFKKTSEPKGKIKKTKSKQPIFVIQKHAASHLHYDFRLEIEGVLKSWAVPKGPSLDPKIKRLAIPTEDHPLEYAQFEGVIPQGEYGGGTVMIWDYGTFENIKKHNGKKISLSDSYDKGSIEVFLHGKKLVGAFALIKTRMDKKDWLLIKMRDDFAHATKNPIKSKTKSAKTDRTMLQITKEKS